MWVTNQAVTYKDIPEAWIILKSALACHKSCFADCSSVVMIQRSNPAQSRSCVCFLIIITNCSNLFHVPSATLEYS